MQSQSASGVGSRGRVVAAFTDEQIDRIGERIAKAWHDDPPKALVAIGDRQVARISQLGESARRTL